MSPDCQHGLINRLVDKVRKNVDKIACYHEDQIEGADVVVVSYGITSRIAMRAVRESLPQAPGVRAVTFVLFNDDAFDAFRQALDGG